MNLKCVGLLLCLFVTIFAAACADDSSSKAAAVVNGEEITMQDLNKRVEQIKKNFEAQGIEFKSEEGKQLEQEIVENALDGLIEEILVIQQAEKEGVLLSEEEVDKKIEEIKASFSSEEEYEKELQNMNITEGELRRMILIGLSREKLFQKITSGIEEISDEEALEYYQNNQEQFTTPKTLVVRHILFFAGEDDNMNLPVKRSDEEAQALAEQIIEQLDQGMDFADLAKEKSEDIGTKADGGMFQFSPEQGMVDPEFAAAAEALNIGEYTKLPVRSQFGYHVIKLEEIIPASQAPFEEVKLLIKDQLMHEIKAKHYVEYMDDVKKQASIIKDI